MDESDDYYVECDEVKKDFVEDGRDVVRGGLVGVGLSFGVFIVLFIIWDNFVLL